MTQEEITKLFTVIAKNSQTESIFLNPFPQSTVDLKALLDGIADIRGISREQNGAEYNKVIDDLIYFDSEVDEDLRSNQ